MISAMDLAPGRRPVERGDLSLALAGAELIDLLAAGAVTLDGDRIVPGPPTATPMGDRLLDQAAESLAREAPYESVDDWLWRRGRDLATAYRAALEAEGLITRGHRHWMPLRTDETELADSLDRRRARDRLAANEPVLAALATALRIRDDGTESEGDDAIETVLAAVNGALIELETFRQRRAIEQAAFDNVWRGD